jgi:DNA-binding NarL/FixJ family response regulator
MASVPSCVIGGWPLDWASGQAKIQKRLAKGATPTDIARELRVSRGTVYKAKHQMEEPA